MMRCRPSTGRRPFDLLGRHVKLGVPIDRFLRGSGWTAFAENWRIWAGAQKFGDMTVSWPVEHQGFAGLVDVARMMVAVRGCEQTEGAGRSASMMRRTRRGTGRNRKEWPEVEEEPWRLCPR